MRLAQKLRTFLQESSGAATVDWIVLSAAGIGAVIAVASLIGGTSESLTDQINARMSESYGAAAPADETATTFSTSNGN